MDTPQTPVITEDTTAPARVAGAPSAPLRTRIADAMTTERGFTIMEILIVLAIIALIMGVLVGPMVFGKAAEAKERIARQQLTQFAGAYERWQMDHRAKCPDSVKDLAKYLRADDVADPWGEDYIMVCGDAAPPESGGFGLMSKGADGKQGTEDDLKSWDKQ